MILQLSLEILLSMSIALLIAAMFYSLYTHTYAESLHTSASIDGLANLSIHYSESLLNSCRCAG